MLSPAEKTGLENLLEYLDNCDLFSLYNTVTKRMLEGTQNRKEAITTILSCIEKPTDLLRRQKISKKSLYSYLVTLCGGISAESSKIELINKCLQEWQSTETSQTMDCWDTESEVPENPQVRENASKEQSFGAAFVKWFFPLYNNLQDFGVQHFWQDVMLKFYIESPFENKDLDIASDSNCVKFLTSLIAHYKFSFLPNDSSVQWMQEAHGLIKIGVKGTVHQHNNPIGIFDFYFGLIRNPEHDNNYRIKNVLLCLKMNVAFQNLLPLTQ